MEKQAVTCLLSDPREAQEHPIGEGPRCGRNPPGRHWEAADSRLTCFHGLSDSRKGTVQ